MAIGKRPTSFYIDNNCANLILGFEKPPKSIHIPSTSSAYYFSQNNDENWAKYEGEQWGEQWGELEAITSNGASGYAKIEQWTMHEQWVIPFRSWRYFACPHL